MRSLDPIYFAPQPKLGGGWICWKDSPSPPPAPDYTGAAAATAAGNLEAARAATSANRINQYTPYGSQVYTQLGPDQWRSVLSLEPRAQQTLDSQMDVSRNLGNLTQEQLGRVNQQYSSPMDLSSVEKVADQSYADQTARLDPQWDQRKQQFDQQMANQGITAGGEAYDNASRDFGQQRNDAYTQARQAALATMPQTYQLATSTYNQPLNTLNAIRTGAQVQNPTFQPAGMQGAVPGTNYLGAAQAQGQYDQGLYNSQVGQQNSMMGGLFSLGAGIAGAPAGGWLSGLAASDRRLKRDIRKVADDARGFGWYSFRYLWSDTEHIGVMADEVPHAAVLHPAGFLMVDYGRL